MNAATWSGARSRRIAARRGAWGLGIGDWGDWWVGGLLTDHHAPQSPIPNPQPPTASVFLHSDEDLAVAAPDEQLGDAPRLNLAELARGVVRVRDALPVDRQDHVALAQRAGRRPIRFEVGDHRAGLAGRQA